ncbi:MAG: IRE (iron responsive element), partial [Pirellulaceae bacterium]|nr:IRE (iron responsive element) [Pirellulaceae bacterium]
MNLNSTFKRKVAYITGIVLLLFPLFFLGQPATSGRNGNGEVGGKLAQLRAESELAQSNLGEINPVSSSMQLATFGLRPVAVIILWEKATKFQKMEDYDNVTATINQISKLQPNFISIWKFQAHNLAYNISVDFDNYRHRYQWVR